MSLTGESIKYLQQQFPEAFILKKIILQDDSDGNGPYIKYWGVGTPKPTEAEIAAAAASMVPKLPKPTVEERLEMIYKDMKNGTNSFVAAMDKHVK